MCVIQAGVLTAELTYETEGLFATERIKEFLNAKNVLSVHVSCP